MWSIIQCECTYCFICDIYTDRLNIPICLEWVVTHSLSFSLLWAQSSEVLWIPMRTVGEAALARNRRVHWTRATKNGVSRSSRFLLGLDLKGRLYCVRQSCCRQVSGRCRGENATAIILTLLLGRLLGHGGGCGLLEELLSGGMLGERWKLLLPGQLLWRGVLSDEHLLRLRLNKGCWVLPLEQELPLLIGKACHS